MVNKISRLQARLRSDGDFVKAGSQDKGEEVMRKALTIVRGRTDLPRTIWVNSQVDVMRQYAACLKESHRKSGARLMEMEIVQLQGERQGECVGCTMNATAPGAGLY